MQRLITSLFLIFLALLTCANAHARDDRPKAKNATTPEQAVQYLVAAARSGDVAAYTAQLAAHSRTRMDTGIAFEALDAALHAKFGKTLFEERLSSIKKSIRRDRTIQLHARTPKGKNKVFLTVWRVTKRKNKREHIREETWIAVKEKGSWKLILPPKGKVKDVRRKDANGKEIEIRVLQTHEVDAKESAADQKLFGSMKQIVEKLTKEVKQGKYKTHKAAKEAFKKAFAPFRESSSDQ